jgi:nitrite reductase/ring-hydroxylating ferredoxin subunit
MNADAWRSFPNAPAEGTPVCAMSEVPRTGVKSFDIDGFPLILVVSAEGLRAYVNACPHQFLPLDWRSDAILSGDAELLRCSNHDAGFDACTGAGLDGFAQGCALDPVPITVHEDALLIGGASDT